MLQHTINTRRIAGSDRRRIVEDNSFLLINATGSSFGGLHSPLSQNHGIIYIAADIQVDPDTGDIISVSFVIKLGHSGAGSKKNLKGLTIAQVFDERYTGHLGSCTHSWVMLGAIVFDNRKRIPYDDCLPHDKTDDDHRAFLIKKRPDLFKAPSSSNNQELLIGFDYFNTEHIATIKELTLQYFDADCFYASRSTYTSLNHQVREITDVDEKIVTLKTKRRWSDNSQIKVLLCTFPGWGKSYTSLHLMSKHADPYTQVGLLTTPIIDTLNDFRSAERDRAFGSTKFKLIGINEFKERGEGIVTHIHELMKSGTLVVVTLSVQRLRMTEDTENADEEVMMSRVLQPLLSLPIGMWIRDERHDEYNGPVTREVLGRIKTEILLDLTATAYRELAAKEYEFDEIVSITLAEAQRRKLNGANEYQRFPTIKIEAFDQNSTTITSLLEATGYELIEGIHPGKWVAVDKDGDRIYPNLLVDATRRMYCGTPILGEYTQTDDRRTNPLEIISDSDLQKSHSDKVALLVLPEGGSVDGVAFPAEYRIGRFCEESNKDVHHMLACNHFISAYDQIWNTASQESVVNQLLEKHNRVIIVTHQRFLVGVNIPQLGHIVLFDRIGSINLFEQMIGRLYRSYTWKDGTKKDIVKLFVMCPDIELQAHVYQMSHAASEMSGDIIHTEDYFRCWPMVLYGKTIEIDDFDIGAFEEAYREFVGRLRDGKYSQRDIEKYHQALLYVTDMTYNDMGGDVGSVKIRITGKTGSRKSVVRRTVPDDVDAKNRERFGRDGRNRASVLTLLMNEVNHVGYIDGCGSIVDAFQTKFAEALFSYDNVTLALQALQDREFREDMEFGYSQFLEQLEELTPDERYEVLFQNKEYKRKIGLVYVSPELARELTSKLNNKYKGVIIVINALSGSIPHELRGLFPESRIICVEHFPYYVDHLTKQGFEVVDLEQKVDNFTFNYMNTKLQQKIKEGGVACVLGNPPFQPSENENTKNIWPIFLKKSFELVQKGGTVALVTPRTWTTNNLYQDVFLQKDPLVINIDECKKHFPGVGSTFSYFIIKNQQPTTHSIQVIGEKETFEIEHMPLFGLGNVNKLALSILEKTLSGTEKLNMITSSGYNTMKFSKNDSTVSRTKSNTHQYPVLHKTKNGVDEFFYSSLLDKTEYGIPRVIVNIWVANYEKMVVSDTLLTCEQYRHFPVKTLEEAENLRKILLSPLYKFIANSLVSGGSHTHKSLSQFPVVDLSRSWTNEQLYKHFNLKQEEIDLIEKTK